MEIFNQLLFPLLLGGMCGRSAELRPKPYASVSLFEILPKPADDWGQSSLPI